MGSHLSTYLCLPISSEYLEGPRAQHRAWSRKGLNGQQARDYGNGQDLAPSPPDPDSPHYLF